MAIHWILAAGQDRRNWHQFLRINLSELYRYVTLGAITRAMAMFSDLPKLIEIEPTLTCNLRCKMCHVSYEATESRSTFPPNLTEKLAGLNGVDILLGSNYEPTMNRGFPEIVRS